MSALVKQLRLLQAWYLPAGPEPEEAMPSKYRAFKEAADRIVELERDLAARDAELAAMKQRAEAAERESVEFAGELAQLNDRLIPAITKDRDEWKRKAEDAEKALQHQRTALSIVRDRQCHDGVCTIALADIEKGIAQLDAAIAAKGEA